MNDTVIVMLWAAVVMLGTVDVVRGTNHQEKDCARHAEGCEFI